MQNPIDIKTYSFERDVHSIIYSNKSSCFGQFSEHNKDKISEIDEILKCNSP